MQVINPSDIGGGGLTCKVQYACVNTEGFSTCATLFNTYNAITMPTRILSELGIARNCLINGDLAML